MATVIAPGAYRKVGRRYRGIGPRPVYPGVGLSAAAALLGDLDGVMVDHDADSMAYRSGGGALDYDDVRETGATAASSSPMWTSGVKLPISGPVSVYTKGLVPAVSNTWFIHLFNSASPTTNSYDLWVTGGNQVVWRVNESGTIRALGGVHAPGSNHEVCATVDPTTGRFAFSIDGGAVVSATHGAFTEPSGIDTIAFGRRYTGTTGYLAAGGVCNRSGVVLKYLSDAELQAGPPWNT